MVTLGQTVREAATRFADRTAFVSPTGLSVSYDDLDQTASRTAAGLVARGITEGDVVALVLPPCPEYIVVQVAVDRIGAIVAGVNHRLLEPERSALLRLVDPRMVVCGPGLAPVQHPPGSNLHLGADVVEVTPANSIAAMLSKLIDGAPSPRGPAPDPDRPVAIVFTSGTTGTPKGAVFAQRQIDFITTVDTGGRWAEPDAQVHHGLSGMSLTHLGPTTKLTGNLMRGGTTHLVERWSPTVALDLVQRHRMPVIAGVPTQVALMLHHPDLDAHDLSGVRMVVMGGGPVSPALVRGVRDRLGVPVVVRYSCTEAGIGVGTAPSDAPEDAEFGVGRPHDGVEVTIRDPFGARVPHGAEGEVCLRSPAVMSGYWQDPEATDAAMWPDGSVRTGDLGSFDDRGRLRLSGRAGDMYVRGGYNVHPSEVEAALVDHPDVSEVAVVAREDEVMGEIGAAVVVPTDPASPPSLEELRRHAGTRIAGHKLPEYLVVARELPRTPMEKLDRGVLGRWVADAG